MLVAEAPKNRNNKSSPPINVLSEEPKLYDTVTESVLLSNDSEKTTSNKNSFSESVSDLLSYSVHNSDRLSRGCLFLFPEEAEKLNLKLATLFKNEDWKFQVAPSDPVSSLHPGKKEKQGIKSNNGYHLNRNRLVSPKTARQTENSKEVTKETSSTVSGHRTTHRLSQTQLKRLPDWAGHLHRVLHLLCQTEIIKPFVSDIAIHDPKYYKVYETIQPGLIPIGLRTIVSKLEQNGYQSALDVFNDVYGVWLSSYRMHTPGSLLWIQTYQASRTFLQQIANQPLRDDFTDNLHENSLGDTKRQQRHSSNDAEYSNTSSNSESCNLTSHEKKITTHESAENVEKLFQEFLTSNNTVLQTGASAQDNSEGKLRSSHRVSSRVSGTYHRGKRTKNKVSYPPITESEREMFQSYLTQLQAKHHLMLFEAFRKAAVWRLIEGGEVELDDTKTSPPVFRKMITWCRSQIAVGQPPEKRLKLHTSTDQQQTTHDQKNQSIEITGVGKFVPTYESTGGKILAQSYIQSRYDAALTQPRLQRSTSLSSSSNSSFSSSPYSTASDSEQQSNYSFSSINQSDPNLKSEEKNEN